ncbi:MAG: tRNA (adenosine(37)-N6)-threonylcarbamoyltransferase complex ATPase subunit type 1 TsaE [Minisyncoccia bacterium]
MEKVVNTLEEFDADAARFAGALAPSEYGAALVVLSGELGAGKTAFTKAVARTLGIEETVSSPTFVIEKIYLLPKGHLFKRLVHIDAYRLEKGSDLAPLGFHELMRDPENLILLEWPEKVAHALPPVIAKISFTVLPDGARKISYG